MKVSCPSCQTHYNIDDKRIPPGGAKLKCAKCQTMFPISAQSAAVAVPLPGGAGAAVPLPGGMGAAVPLPGGMGGAVPLPGLGMPKTPPPPAGAIPLPGGRAPAGAVPLPGAPSRPPPASAVPLPGFSPPPPPNGAVPLPGGTPRPVSAAAIPLPGTPRPPAGAVPLPGLGSPRPPPLPMPGGEVDFGAIPLPGAARSGFTPPPPPSGAVPLPGKARGASVLDPEPGTQPGAEAIPLPGMGNGAVPLPGNGAGPTYGDDDFLGGGAPAGAVPLPGSEDATQSFRVPLPGAIAPPPPSEDVGFADADLVEPPPPAPAASSGFDFSDLPAPADQTQPRSAPSNDFDFAEPPPPPAAPTGGFDFSELPPPPAPAPAAESGAEFDFSEVPPAPATSAKSGLDFDLPPPPEPPPAAEIDFSDAAPPPPAAPEPPPDNGFEISDAPTSVAHASPMAAAEPAPPTAGFGEVDFGDPVPPPAAPDSLEFDPSGAPPPPEPSSSSAPPPAADGLEMLSFIDDAAKDAKAPVGGGAKAKRFHVRRKSGKVFGPFDEGVVVKMLEDGQLLGNEDVSTDGDNWSAIGSVEGFGGAIQKLMEAPAKAGQPSGTPPPPAQSAQSMERMKKLYEGRMAAVTVVDRRAETAKLKAKIPLFAAAGVLALALLGGASLAFTRYGAFGVKKFLPATVSAGSPEFTQLEQARKFLSADTFKTYTQARDAAAQLLTVKEYPEARAVWCQAVFYLQRRYAAAGGDLPTAVAALEDIQLLGLKHPEVAKALAGQALIERKPDEAIERLAVPRFNHEDDLELAFLNAEALTMKGNQAGAKEELKRVLAKQKDSAKALHAMGALALKANDAEGAAKAFADALAADPNHAVSALELAAVELLIRNEPQKGLDAVSKALEEKSRALLGPAELARAHALRGVGLSALYKGKEAIAEFEEAKKLDPGSVFVQGHLAKVYLAQRNYDQALPLYKDATAKEPNDLEYADGYLSTLIALGKMEDALNFVKAANARFVGNARIAYLYGRVNDALDIGTEAEGHYKRAINADPKLFDANLYLARFYLRFRRIPEAKAQLDEAFAKAPEHPGVRSGMGELALAEEDLERARAEYEKALELDPNHVDAHLGLSKVMLQTGDAQGAKVQVDKALALDPAVKKGRLQRGLVLWKLGDLKGATDELEQAKAQDAKDAKISITIGAVKLDANDLPGAEAAIAGALTVEPFNPEAHFYMARVKSRRAEHTQAIDSMRTALEHAPKRASYHYEMGVIYREARKATDAMEAWKKAIELEPGYADALEALGQAHLDRGEFDEAIKSFEAALKSDPKRTRVLGLIGDCHFQAAKWDQAISRYQSALKSDPSLTQLFYKIGRAYTELNDHARAIEYYKRATVSDSKNAMPFWYLAFAHKHKNNKAAAIEAFKAYLARKPDAEDKKEIEDEIYDLEH